MPLVNEGSGSYDALRIVIIRSAGRHLFTKVPGVIDAPSAPSQIATPRMWPNGSDAAPAVAAMEV